MTKSQMRSVETLKKEFFKYYAYGLSETHEFKEVSVEEWEDVGTVYVHLEMGRIGDEGTLSEVFCRNETSVCIGKRGGYFSYRESTHKRCTLSLLDAITWGEQCKRIREKMMRKKEA